MKLKIFYKGIAIVAATAIVSAAASMAVYSTDEDKNQNSEYSKMHLPGEDMKTPKDLIKTNIAAIKLIKQRAKLKKHWEQIE